MSEVQTKYAIFHMVEPTDAQKQHNAWRDVAQRVGWLLDDDIDAADATVQRAADLLTLFSYRGPLSVWQDHTGQYVTINDDGVLRHFFGDNSIAEAAAFVRGGGG